MGWERKTYDGGKVGVKAYLSDVNPGEARAFLHVSPRQNAGWNSERPPEAPLSFLLQHTRSATSVLQ